MIGHNQNERIYQYLDISSQTKEDICFFLFFTNTDIHLKVPSLSLCCRLVRMEAQLIGIRDVSILTALCPLNNACLVTEGHMQGWIAVSEN